MTLSPLHTAIAGALLLGFVHDAHSAVCDLPRHLIMQLIENVSDGRHGEQRKGVAVLSGKSTFGNTARNLLCVR